MTFVQRLKHYRWISDPSKNCGPFQDGTAAETPINDLIQSSNYSKLIFHVFAGFVPSMCLMLISLFAYINYRYSLFHMHETSVNLMIDDFRNQEAIINGMLLRKQRKIEILEK